MKILWSNNKIIGVGSIGREVSIQLRALLYFSDPFRPSGLSLGSGQAKNKHGKHDEHRYTHARC